MGSPPAVVMGISGKHEQLVDITALQKRKLPLIRRFSGGGTIIADENTLFVTFIFNEASVAIPTYPEPIMRWTERLYKEAIPHPDFHLRDNDYVLGQRKCGGNAQYIRKERWLHHSSLLWDYDSEKMSCLYIPQKMPAYRQGRPHEEFLCKLKDYLPTKETLHSRLEAALDKRFEIKKRSVQELSEILKAPHRRALEYVDVKKVRQ